MSHDPLLGKFAVFQFSLIAVYICLLPSVGIGTYPRGPANI